MKIEFRPIDPHQNLNEYSQLLSCVFVSEKKFNTNYLDWLYLRSPDGSVYGFDAFDNDQLIAHYATIPILIRYKLKSFKFLLSLNTATHPKYHGQGLFTALAKETYASALTDGYHGVIGVSNQHSTHGFVNKLGFKLIRPLDVRCFPPFQRIATIDKQANVDHAWSGDSLKWRLQRPNAKYYYIQNNNQIIVYCLPYLIGPKVIVGIFASDSPMAKIIKTICKQGKWPSLGSLLIGLNLNIVDSPLAFHLPNFLKPSPLNYIYKPLNTDFGDAASDISCHPLDFDIF